MDATRIRVTIDSESSHSDTHKDSISFTVKRQTRSKTCRGQEEDGNKICIWKRKHWFQSLKSFENIRIHFLLHHHFSFTVFGVSG